MKILVYGAGAVGMTCGGFLSRRHDVTLLGRPVHLEAMRRQGIRVSGIWGRHCFRGIKLAASVLDPAVARGGFETILVCVKSYDTVRAARDAAKIAGPESVVISLQNGLGNLEALARHLPRRQIVGARVIFGVEVPGPGTVKVTVMASPTAFGEASCRQVTPRVKNLAGIFSEAGLPAVPCRDIERVLWTKVVYNAALNPLASILGCHYGFLAEHPLTRSLMNDVIEEIYQVAGRLGVKLDPASAGAYRRKFYAMLVPRTYGHHPSMLQDLSRGRKTEIEAINGAVVRAASRLKLDVPVNVFLRRAILERERLAVSLKKVSHAS